MNKTTIESELLAAAVSIIDLVPSRAGIPSSEFIRLVGSNGTLQLSLSADVYGTVTMDLPTKTKFTAFVDRGSFVPFVMAARESGSKAGFLLSVGDKGQLVIRCGRRRGLFNKLNNVGGYNEVAKINGTKIVLSAEQKKSIALAAQYATPDPTVAHLNCIYLQKDGHVLASNERSAIRLATKPVGSSMPLPLGILRTIEHELVKTIVIGSTVAKIGFGSGFICQTVNQKSAANFPHKSINAAMVAATAYPRRFRIPAKKLLDAITRMNSYSATVVKRDPVIKIIGVKGESAIKVVCQVPQGSFSEVVPLDKALSADFIVEWMLELLLPLLTMSNQPTTFSVKFEDKGKTPYFITAPGLELLISRRVA